MENKCGLINPNNPCRCAKKRRGFIKDGLIDPSRMQFKAELLRDIRQIAFENNTKLDSLIEGKYLSFFKQHPYENKNLTGELIKSLLINKDILDIFKLN
jgi:hypothetical protein